jgi:hypothetical protein
MIEFDENQYVVCNDCGENLGTYRPFFANAHREKYPDHKSFTVKIKKVEGS